MKKKLSATGDFIFFIDKKYNFKQKIVLQFTSKYFIFFYTANLMYQNLLKMNTNLAVQKKIKYLEANCRKFFA